MNTFTLLRLNDSLSLTYGFDRFSGIFLCVVCVLFISVFLYSIAYMKEKEHKASYYVSFCISFFSMVMMSLAANLFTFYLNYELMTLASAPLVMHDRTKEALNAGFKYLIYSFFGAYLVLFGFFVLSAYSTSLAFIPGGNTIETDNAMLLRVAVFSMILGFSVKAGMWPFHAWLTSAHPVAVSPASALLSGSVVNAGAAGIIRLLRYTVSPIVLDGGRTESLIEGTPFQSVWTGLTLATIVMGSLLAFFEPVLKKRLAYSTISQMSYLLFGLSLMNETAYNGAILQLLGHAFAKCALFLIAGLMIKLTGCVRVEDFKGIGRKHPYILACFTIASLSMIGIPPTGGFAAKYYLILGALERAGLPAVLGPLALMLSALLTAGYLLPIAMKGFLPGHDFEYTKESDTAGAHGGGKVSALYGLPIGILTALSLLAGLFSGLFI
ncbi:MAG: proton-conducting membrane transporter [Lachnospiraceae bacterium]|nr:proton-conducting membrane transporter [Lachnospiraceae bacterium]